jgi:hypothetical protein
LIFIPYYLLIFLTTWCRPFVQWKLIKLFSADTTHVRPTLFEFTHSFDMLTVSPRMNDLKTQLMRQTQAYTIASLLAGASLVNAHGYVYSWTVNGKTERGASAARDDWGE